MTEKAELDRVRAIQGRAENFLRQISEGYWVTTQRFCVGDAAVEVWWTRAELLAWPAIETELASVARLQPHNVAWCPAGNYGAPYTFKTNPGDNSPRSLCAADSIARGLCLYREMLDDEYRIKTRPELPTGHPAPGSTGLRLNEEQREALGGPHLVTCKCGNQFQPNDGIGGDRCSVCCERAGRYWGNDPGNEATVAALTAALPANVEARKRNVAALAAELRKPFEPRFPPEGRSDRVYGGRRW